MTVTPSILYFGTPVALLSTENENGSVNLAPMSSAWALGQVIVLALGGGGQTARNLRSRPDLVVLPVREVPDPVEHHPAVPSGEVAVEALEHRRRVTRVGPAVDHQRGDRQPFGAGQAPALRVVPGIARLVRVEARGSCSA